MVYITKTYELCHPLTKLGEKKYQQLLIDAADEILYKHSHPVKWVLKQIFPVIKVSKNLEI